MPRRLPVPVRDDALDVVGGQALELLALVARAREVDRVHVHVPGEHPAELVLPAGEDVDDPARNVRSSENLGEGHRRKRALLRGDDHGRVAADDDRGEARNEPGKTRLFGRDDADDAGRLWHREVEVRAGDGVRRAEHLRELVRPPRVPDPGVDRGVDLGLVPGELDELGPAALHDLGHPVEHLAPVVGGHGRPLGEGLARGAHRVANILTGSARDVGTLGLVRAAGLRAGERTADVELVSLLDRKPHAFSPFRAPHTRPAALA
jgi:hypothetical protein